MTHDDHDQPVHESAIRERAFAISLEPDAADPDENWLRAERELHEAIRQRREQPFDAVDESSHEHVDEALTHT